MSRKEEIAQIVEGKFSAFAKASDEIWEHAELCYQEVKSCVIQKDRMRAEGFEINEDIKDMPTAFIASYGSGHPIVAILGEYDALASLNQDADCTTRQSDEPSKPGHGCGHNLLGGAAMSAATAVKDYMQANGIAGTVRYYGCPAEEGGSAKTFMARDGYFDDCDIALTWHPAQFNYAWSGKGCLGTYNIVFSFKGLAAHAAASPQLGRSALDAAELLNIGSNYLREHVIDDARIHYAYRNAGGTAPNVVQAETEISYVIRAQKMQDVYDIADRVINIAKGAALMTDTTMTYRVVSGTCNLRATPTVFNRYKANLCEALPVAYTAEELAYAEAFKADLDPADEGRLIDSIMHEYPEINRAKAVEMNNMPMANFYCTEEGNMASTDAGDVTWVVPGCQLHVACYPAGVPFHSWQMVAMGKSEVSKHGMKTAANVIAMTALDFFLDPALVKQAREDFDAMMGDEGYRCPLPAELKPEAH